MTSGLGCRQSHQLESALPTFRGGRAGWTRSPEARLSRGSQRCYSAPCRPIRSAVSAVTLSCSRSSNPIESRYAFAPSMTSARHWSTAWSRQ